MKIAVVILNWNGRTLLEQFLPSVCEYSSNATIYVADNASSDDSIQYIKETFPEVKIIQNKTNGGYAKGYNDALHHIDEALYCLLNSDVEVTPHWLDAIYTLFETNTNVAAIQPKILDYKNKSLFEYAGAAGGFVDQLGYPYCRGRIFETIEEDVGQYNDITPIFWASGACLFIRSTVFKEVGGFDEDFFAHQEEIDLCWRIQNKGYTIMYTSESTVFHLGGATLHSMNPKKTFLNFRNTLYMLVKNVSGNKVWFLIWIRLLLDGIAAIKFLIEGRFKHSIAILKAHFSFYKNISKMTKKRKKLEYTHKYYVISSILWNYFILKCKKYTNL